MVFPRPCEEPVRVERDPEFSRTPWFTGQDREPGTVAAIFRDKDL
jgi:hypothetical protein